MQVGIYVAKNDGKNKYRIFCGGYPLKGRDVKYENKYI